MDLQNTTALVTGASGGIGEEFAVQLAARGANLVLVARRADKLAELRARLLERHPGRRVEVITADLSVPGAAADLAGHMLGLGVGVDVLVNNAGVGSHGTFVDDTPDAVAAQIQLNCGSLADLTARFLPAMQRNRRGLIINVASTSAFQPVPTMAIYAATKAFVLSFTEALWSENRRTGVRILTLCPGPTETAFFAGTGTQFMTRGWHTPTQVVTAALSGVDSAAPTVIPGAANKVSSLGYRILPRRVMLRMAQQSVKPIT